MGNDTVYAFNRIAVPTYSCPYDTISTNLNKYYLANMPQFLQRNICKYGNGLVSLYDTCKIVIIPNCALNQMWVFDSIYNKSAVCIGIGSQTIFGTLDSVKTILINSTDTVKLSKSFGLIVFPELYNNNKYYRLSGIENKSSYDSTSLFGEKVPNAWDFYKFNVGDMFCKVISDSWQANINVTIEKNIVTAKTVVNDTYLYTFTKYKYQFSSNLGSGGWICTWPYSSQFTLSTITTSYTNLSSPSLFENKIYPKMIYTPSALSPTLQVAEFNNPFTQGIMSLPNPNIVFYGLDNNGRFYKHMGDLCNNSTNPVTPDPNSPKGLNYISNSYFVKSSSQNSRFYVGDGFGLIFLGYTNFESTYAYNLTNYQKNGIDYFGQPNTIGIKNHALTNNDFTIYPNPVQTCVKISCSSTSNVTLTNSLGQIVYCSAIEPETSINFSQYPNGIYILNWKNSTGSGVRKLIIQH